eukprot:m.148858 g.148858  ORF g.148858 m.148858 type:complete len:50 (+) comp14193_c0_seq2:449-598(+)
MTLNSIHVISSFFPGCLVLLLRYVILHVMITSRVTRQTSTGTATCTAHD